MDRLRFNASPVSVSRSLAWLSLGCVVVSVFLPWEYVPGGGEDTYTMRSDYIKTFVVPLILCNGLLLIADDRKSEWVLLALAAVVAVLPIVIYILSKDAVIPIPTTPTENDAWFRFVFPGDNRYPFGGAWAMALGIYSLYLWSTAWVLSVIGRIRVGWRAQ